MDLSKIMQMAGQMQQQLQQAQAEAAKKTETGEAGGGMVKVVMNGRHEVTEVSIDEAALGDRELLEDLVRAAVNQAAGKIAQALQSSMGSLGQGMGVDLSSLGIDLNNLVPK